MKFLVRLFLLLWAAVTGAGVLGLLFVVRWLRERYGRGGPIPVGQAQTLLHPMRRFLHPVRRSLEEFGVKPGDVALELGPGPGYFTVEAAGLVGDGGRVLCVDLQPGMLKTLQQRLREHGVANAHPVAGDATRLPLAGGSVDVAFLVAVLGEIPDRPRALAELRRVVKPGGALALMETLTDPDYQLEDTLRDLCRASGFEVLDHRRGRLGYTMTFTRLETPAW